MSAVIPKHGFMLLQGIRAASTDSPFRVPSPTATVSPDEEDQAAFDVFPSEDSEAETWTEEKNLRRCDLIDRKYAGTLTPVQTEDLAKLQGEMYRHRQRVAPLPLEDARRLYQELLARINAFRSPTDPR